MDLAKKLAKIFSLIFLASFVASCDPGCVEANEFDKEIIIVDSYPIKDGVEGLGDAQVAHWHDTGLKTNGEAISLEVTGAWTPWYGNDDISGEVQLRNLKACNFCAMNGTSPNCICYSGQIPSPESDYANNLGVDCARDYAAQNDPTKCTCTTQYGSASDYGVYHFPLNKYDKSHNDLKPDSQDPCKYQAGMGLYIALFGGSGVVIPKRAYHLFSQTAVCDVVRDSTTNKCLDANGNDITKYIFTSANDQIFVKNDNDGNYGIDDNAGNDILHTHNEDVKLIIYDTRYDDNYGSYQVSFLGGVGESSDDGLLEYLVRLIENKIMGTPDENGTRQNGIIQTMFTNIVTDSGFISLLQICLSLYILFYGFATLIGIAEISKKEIMSRILKISLVMFFTSSTSWYWYDKIVVNFFKDGMDSVIAMFMSFSDENIDPTSGIVTSQMDRASLDSNATRFSYADLIIRNLLSVASAKKIFGLFFGVPIFGPVYIVAIYALIAFFCYTMLTVAMSYVLAVVKLAFVLALGPIFISFTLSSHTSGMFKKWLAFIGSRSLEIIFIFLVLYNFLVLIDQNFTSLLSYKACVTQWNLGFFSIPILKSEVGRTLVQWCTSFIMLAGLIFITKLVLDKVPDLASSLITIGGAAGKATESKIAGGMFEGIAGVAQSVGGMVLGAGITIGAKTARGIGSSGVISAAGNAASKVARAVPGVGVAMDTANKVASMMPSNPRAMYRNSIIDAAISRAQSEASSKGLKEKDKDMFVRNSVVNALILNNTSKNAGTTMGNAPNKSVAIGLNMDSIGKRLDEKLINQPLTDFIKSESVKMKNEDNPLIGKAMRDELNKRVEAWANKNLVGGFDAVRSVLTDPNRIVDGVSSSGVGFNNMKQFIRNQTEYSAAEAAKAFAGKPEKQREYLQHLKDNQFRLDNARANAGTLGKAAYQAYDYTIGAAAKTFKPFDNAFGTDSLSDTKKASESFIRKVSNEERKSLSGSFGAMSDIIRKKTGSFLKHDQGSVLNPFNLAKDKSAIRQEFKEGDRSGLINYLSKNGAEKEQKAIREDYDGGKIGADGKPTKGKVAEAPNHAAKEILRNKRDEKLKESEDRRAFFKESLRQNAIQSAIKDSRDISKDLSKIEKLEAQTWDKFYKQSENNLSAASKYLAEIAREKMNNESKVARLSESIKKKEKDNWVKQDPKIIAEIERDRKQIKDLQKQQQERDTKQRASESDRAYKEKKNKELEDLKQKELYEIAKMKIGIKSLEEIVNDIHKLDSNYTTAEILKLKLSGVDPIKKKEEDFAMAAALKAAIQDQLEKEYSDALLKHSERQKEFLNLSDSDLEKLKKLSGKDLQLALTAHLEKDFPAKDLTKLNEEGLKKLESYGGMAALKEGLSEIESMSSGIKTTLFEKAERLAYFDSQNFAGVGENSAGSTSGAGISDAADSGGSSQSTVGITNQQAIEVPDITIKIPVSKRDLFSEEGKIIKGEEFLAIVGLDENASAQDAERAFRKICFAYHPDKNMDNYANATKVLQDISAAYVEYKKTLDEFGNAPAPKKRTQSPKPAPASTSEVPPIPKMAEVVREMSKEEVDSNIGDIKAAVVEKLKTNDDLSSELVGLEALKEHPDLTSSDKKDKKAAPDSDKNKDDKSSLKVLLGIQINILEAQISSIQAKLSKEKINLTLLKEALKSKVGDKDLEVKIRESEAIIQSCENDENSVRGKLSEVSNEISGITNSAG